MAENPSTTNPVPALKPCPFCGKEPEQGTLTAWCWGYRRYSAGGEGHGLIAMPKEQWNRRSPEAERDATIEECAKVANAHRDKGPWHGTELVVWRRACAQVEDAIRSLRRAGESE